MKSITDLEREYENLAVACRQRDVTIGRLHGLLREMKAAMLGYPMSMRALSSTALLHAINRELGEIDRAPAKAESTN